MLDVDGTLLDPDHRIAPATAAAVRHAREAGLHVLLASGRSARALVGVLDELGLDGPAIAFNGALVFDRHDGGIRAIDGTPLAPGAAAHAYELARSLGVEVGWFTLDGWRVAARGQGIDEEQGLTDEPPLLDPGLPGGAPAPHKLMCIAANQTGIPALHELRERLPPGVIGQFSHPRYLELTATGVDKSRGLEAACAALGLSLAELAAIGDEENDIGMLRASGIGIAMGHASPAVRAAADRVTGSNEEDGAAGAIEALLDRLRS